MAHVEVVSNSNDRHLVDDIKSVEIEEQLVIGRKTERNFDETKSKESINSSWPAPNEFEDEHDSDCDIGPSPMLEIMIEKHDAIEVRMLH